MVKQCIIIHQSELLLLQIQVSRVISQLSDGGRDGLSTRTLTCFKATNRPVLKTLMDRLRILLLYKLEPHILGEYKQLHSSAEEGWSWCRFQWNIIAVVVTPSWNTELSQAWPITYTHTQTETRLTYNSANLRLNNKKNRNKLFWKGLQD